jgi:TolB-like protein
MSGQSRIPVVLRPRSEGQRLAQELTWMPLPDKPSVAVLPFENLSIDPKQEALG